MKVIARQAADVERAELEAMIGSQPELRAEYARLDADARLAKDALPMLDAMQATAGKLPEYARERLQTKVRQTLGRSAAKRGADQTAAWGWRWVLGLTMGTAVVLFVSLTIFHPAGGPVFQVALLDTVGAVRGSETGETGILKHQWKNAAFWSFDKTDLVRNWETNWPGGNKVTAKVIYDRAAGEVRVSLYGLGQTRHRTFVVERNLSATLKEANAFIQENTRQ